MKTTLMQWGLWIVALLHASVALAGDFTHVDYLPTYRTAENNTIITHIEYTRQDVILHLCYVAGNAQEKISVGNTLWQLAAAPNSPEPYDFSAKAIQNVRVNNDLKVLGLSDATTESFPVEKGDVVSFQIHFLRPADALRTVNLQGTGFAGKKLSYKDILLKNADNRFLGHYADLPTNIKLFYTKCGEVKTPDVVSFVTLEEELQRQQITKAEEEWLHNAMQPIKYTPKALHDIKDLECSKRVVLEDILFEDNNADYQKQIDANQTLSVIVAYMREFPEARLVLHGHTDIFGDGDKNINLSKDRVATIKRNLRMLGVPPQRIITIAYGGTQPLAQHVHGGAENRRVEVEIFCKIEGANAELSDKSGSIFNSNGIQVLISDTKTKE